MRVLVTGSNGFVGSHLVEKLIEKNYDVSCLVRKTSDLKWIQHLPVKFVYGDIVDPDSLNPCVQGMDYIYHVGGIVRARSESEFDRVNYFGTKNLLEANKLHNSQLKRFVFVSSQAAAGPSLDGTPLSENEAPRPISAYGRSKMKAELEVMRYKDVFPVTIIRPPSVYGPRDDSVYVIFKMIKNGIKPLVGWSEKRVSLVYIHDLVKGICLAAESPRGENQVFFITDPIAYDWQFVMNSISRVLHKRTMIVRFPELLIDGLAFLNEKLAHVFEYDAVLNMDKAREMKQRYWLISNSKAEKLLDFKKQVALENGLQETVDWYKKHGWL